MQQNGSAGATWVAKGADVVLFEPDDGPRPSGISVAEVDGYRAYYPWTRPGGYSRLLVHNTRDRDHPYTLDVFREQSPVAWLKNITADGFTIPWPRERASWPAAIERSSGV